MTTIRRSPLCLLFLFALSVPLGAQQTPDPSKAGNEKVAEIMRTFEGRGVMSDGSDPTPAEVAVEQFELKEGLAIDLVAAEPDISQPLFLSWDSRGRMWVVQYRQYQFPAGLKIIQYDQHLRAVFDKVPEPPPHGVAGADRITVFSDSDGDGKYDSHRDVIEGLNIATAVQTGRGGIWVLNPPYLLFYPDEDGDDIPDSDPEVHLSGFGLQDTHSVANSLLWGPDGWLYGANGSTTVGTVSSAVTKGVHFMGQCIWRYNPETRVFEIYAEGGGNTFSLDIDSKGRVFSGTNGGGTRGFYYPQGSYSSKNWGKHGPLTNPYAFGYFTQMKSEGDTRRFPQAFAIYEGGWLPESYAGSIIAPNAMLNLVWHSERIPDGSTFRTVDRENLLETSDRWFRPVYTGVGPDGGIYLADWYDTRLSHVSPIDDWHKESGRVYRVRPEDAQPLAAVGDLSQIPAAQLVELFAHPNKWVRRRAVLEIGWREEVGLTDQLVELVDQADSLEALWALNLLDGLTSEHAARWLSNDNPHIRRWVARLLGDRHEGHPVLVQQAGQEADVEVRSQLAATAKRVDAATGLAMVEQLLQHDEDLADPHMPLMIWWAIEGHAEAWPEIKDLLSNSEIWRRPLVQQHIVRRLMQRYATEGTSVALEHGAELIELAPDKATRELLVEGLNQAFQGRSVPPLPPALDKALTEYRAARGNAGIVLALRQGEPNAAAEALDALAKKETDLGIKIEIVRAFGDVHHPQAVSALIQLATGRGTDQPALQRVALQSLVRYDNDAIPQAITRGFGSSIPAEHDLRATGCRTLASRKEWSKALLTEINEWRLKASDVPADVVQRLRTYDDPEIVAATEQAFGKPLSVAAPEKVAEINRLTELLSGSSGDPARGKLHFTKVCGNCHKLFGEGQTVGPPLDAYDRGNLKFWLPAIVEPSLEIREGYQSYLALTDDGRVITGVIVAQDPNTVTLRTADDQRIILQRERLEELRALPTSLMPTDVLKDLSDDDLIDLFAYLSLGAKK